MSKATLYRRLSCSEKRISLYMFPCLQTPLQALRKVSTYLGLKLSDERLEQIIEKCSLQNLKKDVDTGVVKSPLVDKDGKSTLYRKGQYAFCDARSTILLEHCLNLSRIVVVLFQSLPMCEGFSRWHVIVRYILIVQQYMFSRSHMVNLKR